MSEQVILRPAELLDVHNIHLLLHDYAVEGVLLDRSEEDITFYLKNFTVAVDENSDLLGCMAVRDFGSDLLEVRSLAIRRDLRKSGIGRKLIAKAIERLDAQRTDLGCMQKTVGSAKRGITAIIGCPYRCFQIGYGNIGSRHSAAYVTIARRIAVMAIGLEGGIQLTLMLHEVACKQYVEA